MARRSAISRWVSASVALACLAAPAGARADITKAQCVEANTRGQDLRRDGKLSEAHVALQACSDPACPAIVRADCTRRLDELQAAQPTIAFEVKDASGSDVTAVEVTVDGKPLTDHLDGNAVPVDIGQHAFTFTVAGQPPISRSLVLTEGEKGRREIVTLGGAPVAGGAAPPAAATLAAPAAAPETPPSSPMPAQKIAGIVVAGAGVAGLAVGAIFGVMTISKKNQQQNDCPNSAACSQAGHDAALGDHSSANSDGAVSTVGFIAGGALLVGGVLLFLTAHPSSPSTTGLLVTPSVGPQGGGLSLSGRF